MYMIGYYGLHFMAFIKNRKLWYKWEDTSTTLIGKSIEFFDYLERSKVIPYLVFYKTREEKFKELPKKESLLESRPIDISAIPISFSDRKETDLNRSFINETYREMIYRKSSHEEEIDLNKSVSHEETKAYNHKSCLKNDKFDDKCNDKFDDKFGDKFGDKFDEKLDDKIDDKFYDNQNKRISKSDGSKFTDSNTYFIDIWFL